MQKFIAAIKNGHLSVLLLSTMAISGALIAYSIFIEYSITEPEKSRVVLSPLKPSRAFHDMSLHARNAFVWDVFQKKVLFAKKPDEVHGLASLTKLATVVTALENNPSSQKVVRLTQEMIAEEGDNGLLVGEEWDIADIVDFTLVTSSNDAARAVASVGALLNSDGLEQGRGDAFFVTLMNKTMSDLGLQTLSFHNTTGLDINEFQAGGYGSARDISRLFEYLLTQYPEALEMTRQSGTVLISKSGVLHQATNTNPNTGSLPNLLASKTGYTDLAGGNLVIAFDAALGRPIIVTVLGSTYEGRFEDVEELTERAIAFIRHEETYGN